MENRFIGDKYFRELYVYIITSYLYIYNTHTRYIAQLPFSSTFLKKNSTVLIVTLLPFCILVVHRHVRICNDA